MKMAYLDTLDATLATGARLMGEEFARRRADYVRSKQNPDGGFSGRRGGSDVYYVDFALRTLTLLGHAGPALSRAAKYLESLTATPRDIVERFSRLHCSRMLTAAGIIVPADTTHFAGRVAHAPADPYDAFLAALCCEILGAKPADTAAEAVSSALLGGAVSQTSTVAASVALLTMKNALGAKETETAVGLLSRMQAPDGGFLAHKAAPEPDLLSTFTALTALSGMRALDQVRLSAAARFVRAMAAPDGGFRSCESDEETDVEYAYYGVGCTALLRHYAAKSGEAERSRNTSTSFSSPA